MLLWQVLVQVRDEYKKAHAAGRAVEWLADRLPNCFVRTVEGEQEHIETPPDWNGGKTFDANYDALMQLVKADATRRQAKRKPQPLLLTPSIEKTAGQALRNLHPVVMIDTDNSATLTH